MGCDIHIHCERKVNGSYCQINDLKFTEGSSPFDWRSYGMYGFLAGVRNYSGVRPISEPRGTPSDMSHGVKEDYLEWDSDSHSASWLSVEELLAFDYLTVMEDRRTTVKIASRYWNGGATAEPGEGEVMTYRDFLGEQFFKDLWALSENGVDRIVFWFDN